MGLRPEFWGPGRNPRDPSVPAELGEALREQEPLLSLLFPHHIPIMVLSSCPTPTSPRILISPHIPHCHASHGFVLSHSPPPSLSPLPQPALPFTSQAISSLVLVFSTTHISQDGTQSLPESEESWEWGWILQEGEGDTAISQHAPERQVF